MEKAFDIKWLTNELKGSGLPVADDMAKLIAEKVFTWVELSGPLHPNAIVKMALPLLVQSVKPIAFKEIDKIDGQVG